MSVDPTATGRLLDGIDRLLARFVAFPSDHARYAVAAWVLHCWTLDAYDSTPRLAALSPEKGSGKTRQLEVLELLVPVPHHTINMSAAVLFRLVGGDDRVTLLMDEADTYLGWKVAKEHEDIRGLVNAGHRRGAKAYRMQMEGGAQVQMFPAFAPVALAGIGDLPDTILDRAIVIAMKRRAPSERVESFRRRLVEPQVAHLVDAIREWATDAEAALPEIIDHLELPAGIEDRPADVWEPLVAIGAMADDPWHDRLAEAAVALNGQRAQRDPSLGVQLLRDVRDIFDEHGVDRLPSTELAEHLAGLEGAPWADIRGVPIDAHGIAKRLRPYEVRPDSHRFGDHTARGYLREDFYDAWTRYLPPPQHRDKRDTRDMQAVDVADVTDVTGSQGGDGPTTVPCRWCGEPCRDRQRREHHRCRREQEGAA